MEDFLAQSTLCIIGICNKKELAETMNRIFSWLEKIVRDFFEPYNISKEIYFSHPNLRILLFAYDKPNKITPQNDKEVFIIRNAWYPENVAKFIKRFRTNMGNANPLSNNIHFLSNTEEIHQELLKSGFNSHFVNINCFVDEDVFKPAPFPQNKIYDAVAIARFSWYKSTELKRHYLMSEVESLALLDPVYGTSDLKYKEKYCSRENCKYYNQERLMPEEVVKILQQSHCGLILSAHEGACRACCEYLAAGLPVVSTPSVGGRDIWLDEYNSLIVEPNIKKIKEAVQYFKNNPRDPEIIRNNFLEKAQIFRDRFKNQVILPILRKHNVEVNMNEFIKENPFFWWPQQKLKRRKMGTSDVVLKTNDFDIGNISSKVLEYILANVKRGSNILEFGSGLSSRELSKAYNVVSIENNPKFVGLFHQQYIYSELQKKDLHYKVEDCLKALSKYQYDVILVDGPSAYRRNNKKSRLGFQKYVNKINKNCVVIFDDVDRFWDCVNLLKTYLKLKREVIVIIDKKKRTGILTLNSANPSSPIKIIYLLYKSFFYRYDGSILYYIFKAVRRLIGDHNRL